MKKLIVFVACLFVFATAFSQQTDSAALTTFQKDQLLRKSRTQKTIGWFIVGTGAPVALFTGYTLLAWSADDYDKETAALVFVGSGLYTLIGTQLIRAGNYNKKRALSVSLINNHVMMPCLAKMNFQMQPAISLRIPLP